MAYDNRYGDRSRSRERDVRGYGRDPYDRDPGAHVDYYRGGDRSQQRTGPEGGFETRSDYRRTDRYADQGQSYGGTGRDSGGQHQGRNFGGTSGPDQGDGFGLNRDTGYGFGPGVDVGDNSDRFQPGGGFNSSARAQAILDDSRRGQSGHDPHYSQWRQRQIEALDRDYDEYRRENSARFDQEFGSWRETRGQQRSAMGRVTEHMDVVGSDDGMSARSTRCATGASS